MRRATQATATERNGHNVIWTQIDELLMREPKEIGHADSKFPHRTAFRHPCNSLWSTRGSSPSGRSQRSQAIGCVERCHQLIIVTGSCRCATHYQDHHGKDKSRVCSHCDRPVTWSCLLKSLFFAFTWTWLMQRWHWSSAPLHHL